MRVRIETKQKSITSLSDVDFQIGEKAPGIKQTMCGIFLEGAFFFFGPVIWIGKRGRMTEHEVLYL